MPLDAPRAALLATAAATVAVAAWLRAGWGGDLVLLWMENLVLCTVPALAAAACWVARGRHEGRLRVAWTFLAAANLSWALGSVVVTYVFNVAQAQVPLAERTIAVPGLADVFFLAFFPLAILGLVRLSPGGSGARSWRMALDGLLILSCVLFLALAAGVGANVRLGGEGAVREDLCAMLGSPACSTLGWVLAMANPLGDVLLASVALFVAMFASGARRAPMTALVGGFLAIAIADIDFSTRWLHGDNSLGNLLDSFWVLGFGLVGSAALWWQGSGEPEAGDSLLGSIIPYVPFSISAGVAAAVQVRQGALDGELFWTAFVAVALVLTRQFTALLDNMALSRQAHEAAEALRSEHQARTRMMHAITHDMLNAMSPIRLQLRLLRDGHAGPLSEAQSKGVAMIHRNAEQMARLAADLKDGASVEEGRITLVPAAMDLAATVRDAVSARQPEAAERGVTLDLDAPETVPMVGDAGRLLQVADNLLSNALKFTPRGGAIQVRLRMADGKAILEVRDSGRGLTQDEAARLFHPFSQVHDPSDVPERGTGLGLFISRGLVERHGGRIIVASQGRGHGSTFTVDVPTTPPGSAEPSAR